jgi:hypothetical protein
MRDTKWPIQEAFTIGIKQIFLSLRKRGKEGNN